jgi:hypothetical protein
MSTVLQPPLTARHGHKLKLLYVCRVSDPGPDKQDERSNDDQQAMLSRWLIANTDLPYEVTVLAGFGSGEWLERKEYLQLLESIESGQFDLVLTEDLGRIARRIHAYLVCELCVDHDTRLIAINDHVDTAQEGWEDLAIFSVWHHERSNRDTAKRIKRTHSNRFPQGGCLSLPIYGYLKKPDAKTDDDLQKLPDAAPIYEEWFRRWDDGALDAQVADWLNEQKVPTGPYCDGRKWTGAMVSRVGHNPLLKGVRFRNRRKSKRVSSGKYVSKKADEAALIIRRVPHLAFFDEAYYDRVIAKVDARNAKYRRNGKGGPDPCQNRPKRRSRFPGQSIYCGPCGRPYVFGAHGQKDHLMCTGARDHVCWNGISVDGPLSSRKILAAAMGQIETLDGVDLVSLEMLNEEASRLSAAREACLREIAAALDRGDREIANLMKFIRNGDDSPSVRAELLRIEEQQQQLRFDKEDNEQTPTGAVVAPPVDEVKQLAREFLGNVALDSNDFAERLRKLTGRIMVWPFRLCDGGGLVLRARCHVQIANLLPDKRLREVLQRPLERVLTIDLFDPPQRVEYREAVMARRARGETERQVAKVLGITQTAAQRAAALDRLMRQLNLTDPYVQLMTPPSDFPKLRRHLHARYHFEPAPGYVPDW